MTIAVLSGATIDTQGENAPSPEDKRILETYARDCSGPHLRYHEGMSKVLLFTPKLLWRLAFCEPGQAHSFFSALERASVGGYVCVV